MRNMQFKKLTIKGIFPNENFFKLTRYGYSEWK